MWVCSLRSDHCICRALLFLGKRGIQPALDFSHCCSELSSFIRLQVAEDFLREQRQVGGWISESLVHLFIISLILSAYFLLCLIESIKNDHNLLCCRAYHLSV